MNSPRQPFTAYGLTSLKNVLWFLILIGMIWLFPSRTHEAPPVEPGKLFAGPFVNIHAPASAGWRLSQADKRGMGFIRRDATTGVTWAAEVLISRPDPKVDLLGAARTIARERSQGERYRTLETRFEVVTERPYPCVRFRGTIQDTRAQTPKGTVSLPIHVRSLIFRHPVETKLVFEVTFSQRGGEAGPELEAAAESFLRGVDLPPAK